MKQNGADSGMWKALLASMQHQGTLAFPLQFQSRQLKYHLVPTVPPQFIVSSELARNTSILGVGFITSSVADSREL